MTLRLPLVNATYLVACRELERERGKKKKERKGKRQKGEKKNEITFTTIIHSRRDTLLALVHRLHNILH